MLKALVNYFTNSKKGGTYHYFVLKRNIILIMFTISIFPLAILIFISHFQYRSHLKTQTVVPLLSMANKTTHSIELFMEQRLSTMRFISAAYSFDELSEKQKINKILSFLKKEFSGFVDLCLIDSKGGLVSYAGPYSFSGKNYSSQTFFHETQIKNNYISNVFLGYRKFPHIVIAVQHLADDGQSWILRATIDTDFFDIFMSSMGVDPQSDVFLISSDNILQTDSVYYGKTLEKCPLLITRNRFKSNVVESLDSYNRKIYIASAGISIADYILVIVQPQEVTLKSWHALKAELMIVFLMSLCIIILIIFSTTRMLVKRVKESDEKRENTLSELQHAQKLSSVGRLAAGVAHEINNPLAIINEKAGLMVDLIDFSEEFTNKSKFGDLTESIIKSVTRCKKITHRLLSFSKRIDITIEPININVTINEMLEFFEKDAMYRKIDIRLKLKENMEPVLSDLGQIQQVLLNLLTNAFAAVEDGGVVTVATETHKKGGVIIGIGDDGCGIPKTIIKNIFDPFFTTKKEKGTGLGLSITYGIIKKLGGQITVSSTEGEGTVFSVSLPSKTDPDEGGKT